MKTLRVLLAAFAVFVSARALADVTQPVLLVASSTMSGAYARTVLFAMPARDGTHAGFVLNRPTDVRLASLKSPVFAGGPEHADTLFAFVRTSASPADRALPVLPGLYLAFRESDVELILERFAPRTRVFAGMVSWKAEELDDEVQQGFWHVLDADVELVLEGSIDSLWSRLIGRAESMTARFDHNPGSFHRASDRGGVAPDALMRNISGELLGALPRIQSDPKRVSALVETLLLPHFDAPRATRIAVGAYWRQASPEQQARLVKEFTTLLVRTYSGALASYGGQKVEFSPLRARPGDAEVTVRSTVRQPGAESIVIEYDLERAGEGWKVFDVRVAGMSLVATYRSAFAEHARNHGIDGLISMLAGKNEGASRAALPRELRM
jgi:phospholipid transport system substrate-binding protein